MATAAPASAGQAGRRTSSQAAVKAEKAPPIVDPADDHDDTDDDSGREGSGSQANEGEDIWPDDVEKSFQEALAIYPPIGRRKLMENGKMYGRNELIARYIYMRTKKLRTRKQVSSHIQVLGKKAKKAAAAAAAAVGQSGAGAGARQASSGLAQGPSAGSTDRHSMLAPSLLHAPAQLSNSLNMSPGNRAFFTGKPGETTAASMYYASALGLPHQHQLASGLPTLGQPGSLMQIAPGARSALSLTALSIPQQAARVLMRHFYAYMEHENPAMVGPVSRHLYVHFVAENPAATFSENDLERVDINQARAINLGGVFQIFNKFSAMVDLWAMGSPSAFYLVKLYANLNSGPSYGLHALTSKYESRERLKLRCSTIVSSFGKPVVEKIQVEDAILENSSFVYYFNQSPMCDYMVHFIEKLKALDSQEKMDKVLENFSVLQVITDYTTGQLYLCTAFLFTTMPAKNYKPYEIYKLV